MGGTFDSDLDISQCGKSSGCVTYPNDCTVHCDFAVSYKTVGDGIRFRVTNKRAPITASYSALGISSDHMMVGVSNVSQCVICCPEKLSFLHSIAKTTQRAECTFTAFP